MARGLFRLWIVGSGMWVVFLFMLADNGRLVEHMQLVVYPPLVVLALGTSLAWAARGFR
jgi:hypothetical protein